MGGGGGKVFGTSSLELFTICNSLIEPAYSHAVLWLVEEWHPFSAGYFQPLILLRRRSTRTYTHLSHTQSVKSARAGSSWVIELLSAYTKCVYDYGHSFAAPFHSVQRVFFFSFFYKTMRGHKIAAGLQESQFSVWAEMRFVTCTCALW